jgi:hypothetical protein
MAVQRVKSTARRIGRIPGAVIVAGSGEIVADDTVDREGRCKYLA